jgi:hypothetical protein
MTLVIDLVLGRMVANDFGAGFDRLAVWAVRVGVESACRAETHATTTAA